MQIMNAEQIDLTLTRLAFEIIENNITEREIVLAGIQKRGYAIAAVLEKKLKKMSQINIRLIAIEMDKRNPIASSLSNDKDLDGKVIIVVDDVANSGRTMLYALQPFLSVIAKKIQIAVLVDRKHKSYPVCSDYVGKQLSTTLNEHVHVEIANNKIIEARVE